MQHILKKFISICRTVEVRALFSIGYLLLLIWPFFTAEPLSLWLLYRYYHSIWGILVVGLALQGYLVITTDKSSSQGEPERADD